MEPITEAFIEKFLSPVLPPRNPLVRGDWAALSFDRNRYEEFAPLKVWQAILDTQVSDAIAMSIVAVPFEGTRLGIHSAKLAPTLQSLREYWREDRKFLKDHYLISESQLWIARLDQDVTLIAGSVQFLRSVFIRMSLSDVVQQMEDDYSVRIDEEHELAEYLRAITKKLRTRDFIDLDLALGSR